MNHLDEDADKYLAQAINLLNKTVNVIKIGHPYAHELLGIIEKLENSEYMKWLAKERFEERYK